MFTTFRRFQRAVYFQQQRGRSAEEKFHDFLQFGFGIRLKDYERMDKDLQAVLNDKFAYLFLHNPVEERVRQFMLSPLRKPYCHAPGCEWREGELTAFSLRVRHCVRCEHYQALSLNDGGSWYDITRRDYEFLLLRDEAHRAQWDTVESAYENSSGNGASFSIAPASPPLAADGRKTNSHA
jgi:hypothetical protein